MSTFRTAFCLLLFIPGTCNMWEKGKMWLKSKSMLEAVKLSYANIFLQIWLIFVRTSSGRHLNNFFFHLSILQYDFHLVPVRFLLGWLHRSLNRGVMKQRQGSFFLTYFLCWVQKWHPFLAYASGLSTNLRNSIWNNFRTSFSIFYLVFWLFSANLFGFKKNLFLNEYYWVISCQRGWLNWIFLAIRLWYVLLQEFRAIPVPQISKSW